MSVDPVIEIESDMADELHDKLRAVFVATLRLPDDVDVDNLAYRDIEAWDSVGHMSLVAAIEDEFDVQFDTDQVIDMSSFTVALDMVRGMTSGG